MKRVLSKLLSERFFLWSDRICKVSFLEYFATLNDDIYLKKSTTDVGVTVFYFNQYAIVYPRYENFE